MKHCTMLFFLYNSVYLIPSLLKNFTISLYLANATSLPSQDLFCETFPNSPFPLDPVWVKQPSFMLSNHIQGLSHCSLNISFNCLSPLPHCESFENRDSDLSL